MEGRSVSYVDELLRIYNRDGNLDAETVVTEATPKGAPLHRYFTWDNKVAAHRYRVEEARALIRDAEVVLLREEKQFKVRAFVNIDPGGDSGSRGYMPTAVALADPASREILLRQLQRDVSVMVRRYETMAEAADLIPLLTEWLAKAS